MCLSHVPLPHPVSGICCKEVSEDNKYAIKDLVIPKAQVHCEVNCMCVRCTCFVFFVYVCVCV